MRDILKNRDISVDPSPAVDKDPLCDDTEDRDDDFWIAFDSPEDLEQAIKNRSVNIKGTAEIRRQM